MKLSRAVLCSFSLLSMSQFSLALPQYINEFHYDNRGADQFEYVEIAGLSGSDLNGWHLDFYNGSNGKIYSTWALSGVIDDEGAGVGALSFSASSGLQNGPNDGIALVDGTGGLIQFISYEGRVTGTEGAALGVTSTDIGLSEGGTVPVGSSLQLSGNGMDSNDFSWVSDLSSFGRINSGQNYIQQAASATAHSVNEPQQLGVFSLALLALVARHSRFGKKLKI